MRTGLSGYCASADEAAEASRMRAAMLRAKRAVMLRSARCAGWQCGKGGRSAWDGRTPSDRHRAHDSRAMQAPGDVTVVEDGQVLHGAVVPGDQVAGLPAVTVVELGPLHVLGQELQQLIALLLREADDPAGV